jgi:spore germination protein KB
MGIWVGGIFVKIALFLWCCVVSLGQAFNLQEYRPLIPPLGVLLVILALLSGESLLELNDFLLHSFPLYGLLFEFFLPLFLLLAANIRARLDPAFPKKP